MIGLFGSKTKLEKFCSELTLDKVAKAHAKAEGAGSYVVPLAMLLIYSAGNFARDLKKSKHLRKYRKRVNADLVILEAILYIHSAVSYGLMDEIYDEDALSDVYSALSAAIAFVEKQSKLTGLQRFAAARGYVPSLETSTERFALTLEHSCFGSEPVLKPGIDLNQANLETHLGLKVHTVAFAKTQIPALTETIVRMLDDAS